ncbi:MAG: GspE/PulE family protein [Gammaproteobacteria bacterium]|nr:GspE/PulE family protein [Gammaproteobacteria bacterium]MCI0590114.1 GspE/PulE family protein [Gammaproteobacteria bacterium]
MTAQRKKLRLGDLLVEHKAISQAQLDAALAEQKKSGRKLGRILIESGAIDEETLLKYLSKQLQVPFVDLRHYKFSPEIIRLIPEAHARRFRAIALEGARGAGQDQGILVGMADPTNIFGYDALCQLLKRPVRLALVRERELLRTIDMVYRKTAEISGLAGELRQELEAGDVELGELGADADVGDAPVTKLFNSLFEDAVQVKASDIHIEPDAKVLRIRQRVDGVLQEHVMNEIRIANALVLKIKLMAGLNISEKRLPQDGRFSMNVKGRNIDVRLSTMPVQYGESVVMRLLDQTEGVLDLDQLGMPNDIKVRFEHAVRRSHGMMLVTGPTGSGKTTTLYAALQLLNTSETKIITVEDPVEYRLPRINQVQVNPAIGLTFARVLRSSLRQDPDVVLVGEMRDEETAEIGLRAAMTGHTVLSTLHTNDAISTVNRLVDMGIKTYLLASALKAILAQRLVRRVCESCAQPVKLDARQLAWLRASGVDVDQALAAKFRRGAGCAHCNNTGYLGRIGVYEMVEIDQEMATILGHGDTAGFAALAKKATGYRSLDQIALRYAMSGITTMEDVLRVSADLEAAVDEEAIRQAEAVVLRAVT